MPLDRILERGFATAPMSDSSELGGAALNANGSSAAVAVPRQSRESYNNWSPTRQWTGSIQQARSSVSAVSHRVHRLRDAPLTQHLEQSAA